ncbi:outer membrane lipoprotein carrier protein LolA [Aliidiomarina minuta]|uniref:Outer-membrane lipoprotein carrier protein n=1 Tax=Aliidiomarina minuta TaxID=880057 RepID=A0A432W728_9GAMM|nr:outer membrane lipoprotein chaperone LolA [Aliidiomarina minuta]RUO25877.1 outer membrane lipoprotein carrier protein LolA [Aliidiomarina minuta]
MKTVVSLMAALSFFAVSAASADETAELRDRLQEIDTLQAQFEQRVYDERDLLQEELQGELTLKRPHYLHWETSQPDHSVMVADGESVWYYNSFIEQLSIFDQAQSLEQNPMLVLLSDSDEAWSDFAVTRENDYWIIRDRTQGQVTVALSVAFDEEGLLNRLRVDDGQGQISVFELSEVTLNQNVAADKFTFSAPEGAEIDDQRTNP